MAATRISLPVRPPSRTTDMHGTIRTRPGLAEISDVVQVASSATVVTLSADSEAAVGRAVFNDSTAILTLKLGLGASTSSMTVKIPAAGHYEVPFGYTGPISGLWAAANGNAYVTTIS